MLHYQAYVIPASTQKSSHILIKLLRLLWSLKMSSLVQGLRASAVPHLLGAIGESLPCWVGGGCTAFHTE